MGEGRCEHCNCSSEIDEMNKKSLKPIKVRFCPACKSTDVGFVFRVKNLFGLMPKVVCYECGHFGSEFPIIVTNRKQLDILGKKKNVSKRAVLEKKDVKRTVNKKSMKKSKKGMNKAEKTKKAKKKGVKKNA